MNVKKKNFLISLLRKGTYHWKPRSEAKKLAKVQIGTYSTGRAKYAWKCAICGVLFKEKETVSDHINPVVPIEGFSLRPDFDLHEMAERMFCDNVEDFQCLCKVCHDKKSKEENEARRTYKKQKEDI